MNSHRRQQRVNPLGKPMRPASRRTFSPAAALSGSPPPPTGGGACAGAPINFGDFDDKGWVRFQAELLQLIDESILSGRWRQASSREAMAGGAAMSCPRF